MRLILAVFSLVLALSAESAPQARIAYFSSVRQVQIAAPDRQNYAVVDESIWKSARPDLGDLRLYAGERELPYALIVPRHMQRTTRIDARLLNAGRVNGTTQFIADLSGVPQYNEVTLKLADSARNFVVRAHIEGLEEPHQRGGMELGKATLFDFSREKLGCNYSLRLLQPSTYRYLRITLPELAPEQVLGASVADTREHQGGWTPVVLSPQIQQSGRTTVISWPASDKVPLARVVFVVAESTSNFRRTVELQNSEGQAIASGEISRIHVVRDGKAVDSESLALDVPETRASSFKVVIQNGDDAPLGISDVKAFALERRLYFEPGGNASLSMYMGDSGLNAPVYDYARLLRIDDHAPLAALGPLTRNPAYTGRPDERPWTERHPALLWTALVLAVTGLGAMALRGMRTSSQ